MTRSSRRSRREAPTTRTSHVLLVLAAAGTAALVALVLLPPGGPASCAPSQPCACGPGAGPAAHLGCPRPRHPRHGRRAPATAPPPRPSWSHRPGAGWWRPSSPPPPKSDLVMSCCPRRRCSPSACPWLRAKGIEVAVADAPRRAARVGGLARGHGPVLGPRGRAAAVAHNQVAAVIVGLLGDHRASSGSCSACWASPALERWLPMGAAASHDQPGRRHCPLGLGRSVAAYGLLWPWPVALVVIAATSP